MSQVVVRPSALRDLPRISDLTESVFGIRRREELLGWLLGNPRAPEQIDSWVAERRGEVVGHVAILKCRYRVGHRQLMGVHPFLWMVEPGDRGQAGFMLGRNILNEGDFLVILGGTPTTRAILTSRKFEQMAEAREYRMAQPPGAGPLHLVKAGGFELVAGHSGLEEAVAPDSDVIVNQAAPAHLEWLADCPDLESHLLVLKRGGRSLGPLLLFVNRETTPVSGRLVYLPCLGEDPQLWLEALAAISHEFTRLGCGCWTLLATHPALVQACESAGALASGRRPVWIKDHNSVLPSQSWHLTYLEGDLAYRRVQAAADNRTPARALAGR